MCTMGAERTTSGSKEGVDGNERTHRGGLTGRPVPCWNPTRIPEALLVHDTVSGKTSMLPTEAGYVSQLCMTPDGKTVIYQWSPSIGVAGAGLRIINVDGTGAGTDG